MALIIKVSSPGPIFFRQERVGYNGERFQCYKFRTMKVGAEITSHQAHLAQLMNSGQPMVKLDAKNDRRLIAGAWLLRASGLDELPQIINIARGDMSVVGPRPCLTYEYDKFESWHKERFTAVPGLTGLWQVSGKNRTTFDEMIKLDIHYSRKRSPWMDLWIILMTVPALAVQIADVRKSRRTAQPAPADPKAKIAASVPSRATP
jgi:lipopolysaccharide/colanic/teichoic acid biosynthesis glycosyltransferase